VNISNSEQSPLENNHEPQLSPPPVAELDHPRRKFMISLRNLSRALFLLVVFVLGLGSGYLLWGRPPTSNAADEVDEASAPAEQVSLIDQINPADGYPLPVSFGDTGPQLLAAGAIDYDRFTQLYQQRGRPLTEEQLEMLTEGSDAPIVIDRQNAPFLLNFFWALGLVNQNPLLEEGPMMQYGEGGIGRFASTGGWTIGTKPVTDLYASRPLITLTPEQQARLEEVAKGVYRPCCNNPTAFPACNHGMAMLGLLELMASQDASVDEMFTAAKYVNAFWFPQQTSEIAMYFKHSKDLDFDEVDARQLVGANFSSATGFREVHQWLASNGQLEQLPSGGNSCGV
jgi:hypothetical protein